MGHPDLCEWVEVRTFPCLKSETWGTHVRLRMKLLEKVGMSQRATTWLRKRK